MGRRSVTLYGSFFLCVRGRAGVGEENKQDRMEGGYPVRSAVNVRANIFWFYFCRMF